MSLQNKGPSWDGSITSYECIDGIPISYYEKRASDDYRDGVGVPDGFKSEDKDIDDGDHRAVLVLWPNGSINAIHCEPWHEYSDLWLFNKIDEWGDPSGALIIIIGSMNSEPVSYDVSLDVGEDGERTIRIDADGHWIRRFKFIGNISHRWLRSLSNRYLKNPSHKVSLDEIAEFSPDGGTFPEPPGPEYSFQQIKEMEPFSGVYFCYIGRVCVYVGEGQDVTDRCNNRKDRQDKMEGVDGIGVLRVDPDNRLRMEKFYIGLLNPARNKEIHFRKGKKPKKKIQQPGIMTHVPIGTDDGLTNLGELEAYEACEDVSYKAKMAGEKGDVNKRIDEALEYLAKEKTDFVHDEPDEDEAEKFEHAQTFQEEKPKPVPPSNLEKQELFKLQEVAKHLSVSPSTVTQLVKKGELKTFQIPGQPKSKFVTREELNRFIYGRNSTTPSLEGGAA